MRQHHSLLTILVLAIATGSTHAQGEQGPETVSPTSPPQLLTPIYPPGCREMEALLIEAAKARAAEEIDPKIKIYRVFLTPERRQWIHAASVRTAGQSGALDEPSKSIGCGRVQFLDRNEEVIAEFYTTAIMGWERIYDEQLVQEITEAVSAAKRRAREKYQRELNERPTIDE